jgi:phosphoribosylformylglycinamidine (FGAM) synthase-like amidotransferase family enzyme
VETLEHSVHWSCGFSNSDVLGSAKVKGALNTTKKQNRLNNFFKREDTLSVGICNGCQLFMEVINPEHKYTEKCYTTKVTNTKVSLQ